MVTTTIKLERRDMATATIKEVVTKFGDNGTNIRVVGRFGADSGYPEVFADLPAAIRWANACGYHEVSRR